MVKTNDILFSSRAVIDARLAKEARIPFEEVLARKKHEVRTQLADFVADKKSS